MPALDELFLHDSLPSRTADPQLPGHGLLHQPFQTLGLGGGAGGEVGDRLP